MPGARGVVAAPSPTWLRCLGHLPLGREEEASAAWWMPDCRRLGLGGFCLEQKILDAFLSVLSLSVGVISCNVP